VETLQAPWRQLVFALAEASWQQMLPPLFTRTNKNTSKGAVLDFRSHTNLCPCLWCHQFRFSVIFSSEIKERFSACCTCYIDIPNHSLAVYLDYIQCSSAQHGIHLTHGSGKSSRTRKKPTVLPLATLARARAISSRRGQRVHSANG